MVGFGSSLRISRRRGWEDAYLDYQSLRLLLTQIEAVYEEECWKRDGNSSCSGNNADLMEGHHHQEAFHDEEDENSDEDVSDENAPGRENMCGKARWMTNVIVHGKSQRRHYRKSSSRKWRPRYPSSRAIASANVTQHGAFSKRDDFKYSLDPEHHRKHHKKGTKEGRALDKGGWRLSGTDYRDELFLVSDEDLAYGIHSEDDDGDAEDDGWEDEEEDCFQDENVGHYDANTNVASNEGRPVLDDSDETPPRRNNEGKLVVEDRAQNKKFTTPAWVKKLSTPDLSEKSEIMADTDMMLGRRNDTKQYTDRDCNSPSHPNQGNSTAENQTPKSQRPRHNEIEFTGSPGVLEAGYETFAAAAARSGFVSPGYPSETTNAGSPMERGGEGWLDFVPKFLSLRGKRQQQTNKSLDPLCLRRESSEQEVLLDNSLRDISPLAAPSTENAHDIVADDSPSKYTHFAETFQSRRSSSMQSSSMTKGAPTSSQHAPPDMAANVAENITTPVFTGLKSITVQATAVGKMLPLTPLTPPYDKNHGESGPKMTNHSELAQQASLANRHWNQGCVPPPSQQRTGGFGVSLNMVPTESSELLLRSPSSPNKISEKHPDCGMTQFYAFKNKSSDYIATDECEGYSNTYQYSNDKERQSCYSGEYDGEDEEEKYSEKAKHNQPRQWNFHDDGEGNFILGFLFGCTDGFAETKKALANQRKSSHNKGIASRSAAKEHTRNQRAITRQKRAAVRAKRKQACFKGKKRELHRKDIIPVHLRRAHLRAAAITERFRGLLRAEVEKCILFANSRLGELSDTIGSLRYSSYEESHMDYPSLVDGGGNHVGSSSDSSCLSGAPLSYPQNNQQETELNVHRVDKRDLFNDDTKKQILLRDRLRIRRDLFQKADFLGDDFSLLSAVDEADAYSAVGVELLHLLKYVCVNIIAARKICKKHDRLLSNRMLGGYYHSLTAAKRSHNKKRSGLRSEVGGVSGPQFGGVLSNQTASSYIFGIYDKRIQHIANSTTMQTVSSSLAIALADFEASQSRSTFPGLFRSCKGEGSENPEYIPREVPSPKHKIFTTSRLRDAVPHRISRQCFRGDDEDDSKEDCDIENKSSTSNYSLTRLQFVVTSIFGLREAARFKSVPFEHYSSRLFMISSGPNVIGDGLDGCSNECLNFFRNYNPDAAYTLDMETIYTALTTVGRGKDGIGDVMVASLAAAANGYNQRHVAAAMSINPQATGEDNDFLRNFQHNYQNILRLNSLSMILYLANYYIIFPTAHVYSISLGSRSASAAVLIGVANLSSLLSSFIHSFVISRRNSFIKKHMKLSNFRLPLILCSVCALAGNLLYSYSLKRSSLILACTGRFLVGLGSSDILNRHLLSTILPPESINIEVASLVKLSMITIGLALLTGSLFDLQVRGGLPSATPLVNTSPLIAPAMQPFLSSSVMAFGHRGLLGLESIGYIMSFLWILHIIGMIFFFDIPKSKRRGEIRSSHVTPPEEDFDSDNQVFDQGNRKPHVSTEIYPFSANTQEVNDGNGTFAKLQTMSRKTVKHHSRRTYRDSMANIREMMFSNVAFPTTIAILCIAKMSTEIILSSCATISGRYFKWSGARSGLLMGLLASMILPVNQTLATSQNISERTTIKVALKIGRYGALLMVNYESVFSFVTGKVSGKHPYDGIFGAPQYILSFTIIFCVLTILESATLTLMSKVHVAPRHTNRYSIDNAFTVNFVSALGRLLGDAFLFVMDISSHALPKDMINSLCLLLIIVFSAGLYLVKKHYFFLI